MITLPKPVASRTKAEDLSSPPEQAGMRLGHPSDVKSSLTATRHVIWAVTKIQLPLAVILPYKGTALADPIASKVVPAFRLGRSVTAHCGFLAPTIQQPG